MKNKKTQSFSRRTFLTTGGTALAAGLTYGLSGSTLASGIPKSNPFVGKIGDRNSTPIFPVDFN